VLKDLITYTASTKGEGEEKIKLTNIAKLFDNTGEPPVVESIQEIKKQDD
jgi:hypothetical protein